LSTALSMKSSPSRSPRTKTRSRPQADHLPDAFDPSNKEKRPGFTAGPLLVWIQNSGCTLLWQPLHQPKAGGRIEIVARARTAPLEGFEHF
jgi:hypothetical protein